MTCEYGFMTAARFEEIKDQLNLGHRFSVDGSQVVAKLSEGQRFEGVSVETHEQALKTTEDPQWIPTDGS